MGPVESMVSRILNPFLGYFYSIGSAINEKFGEQTERRDLGKINKELESQINQLVVDNAKLRVLEEENKKLREYLDFFNERKIDYIMANIISRTETNDINTSVVIDRGRRDKLEPGLVVINNQGVVAGKLSECKDEICQMDLVTSKRCKLAVSVQNQNRTTGVIQGELGLTIKMDYIPQTEIIKPGETIVTSGLEPNIPKGLVVGKIVKVNRENNELWQNAVVEPLVKPSDTIVVSVIRP